MWGADGPSSYDCSGLMMYAWGKAGVSLSHSSKAQAGEGRRVSKDQLMPGDLVFYYSPISHVAMYLGNGRIVHAPRPGKSVEIAPMDEMPVQHRGPPGLTCVLDILIGSGGHDPRSRFVSRSSSAVVSEEARVSRLTGAGEQRGAEVIDEQGDTVPLPVVPSGR